MPISFFCVSTLLAFKCKRNPALLSEMKKFLFLLFSAAALLVTAVPSSRPGGALKHPLSRPSSLRGFLSPRRQVTEQSVLSLSIVLPATHSTLTHTHTHTHMPVATGDCGVSRCPIRDLHRVDNRQHNNHHLTRRWYHRPCMGS